MTPELSKQNQTLSVMGCGSKVLPRRESSMRSNGARALFFSIGLSLLVFVSAPVVAYTPLAAPVWAEQEGCGHHLYLFTTDESQPEPEESSSSFGIPECSVTTGSMSSGWHYDDYLSGEPGHGVWDLGRGGDGGAITITIPIGNDSSSLAFGSYSVTLLLNVVGYVPLYALPSLEIVDHESVSMTISESTAYLDPLFGEWKNRTWSCEVGNVTADTLVVKIVASESGSLIDAVELYAVAEVLPAPVTDKGTPHAWFSLHAIEPLPGDTWDEADFYDDDGDGMQNWQEYLAGTDPTDPASRFAIVKALLVPGERPLLQWLGGTTGAQTPYIIEAASSLSAPVWIKVGEAGRSEGTNRWHGTEVLSGNSGSFFRVVVPRAGR